MSHNYQLLDMQSDADSTNAPRCSAKIAHAWTCKEGAPAAVLSAVETPASAAAVALVQSLFGPRTRGSPNGLGCEPYLRAAVVRWLLTTCRSADSRVSYAMRLWAWTGWSGRRALSAQTDAGSRAVADWLYHLEQSGRAPRTIVGYRETISSWFRWLTDRELMRRSPVTRDVRRLHRVDRGAIQKASGRRQVLTLAEAQQVARWALNDAEPVAGVAVLLQLTAGLRSQEVARLERRHLTRRVIEDDQGQPLAVWVLTVPGKGSRTRAVQLEPVAVAAWQRYERASRLQGERGPLLRAPGGGHYDRRSIQRWAKAAATVVGREREISSHDLRKTCATQLMLRGADIEQVQRLLGHASADTTLTCYITDLRPLRATTGIIAAQESHEPT